MLVFGFYGKYEWKKNQIQINHKGNYYHENSKEIWVDIERKNWKKDYEKFSQIYITICMEIKKLGYEIIEEENSIENIKEVFEEENYRFTENGEVF